MHCEVTECERTTERVCFDYDYAWGSGKPQFTYAHWEVMCLEGVPDYKSFCSDPCPSCIRTPAYDTNVTAMYWTWTYGS